ncbi:type II secretion system F family protein [Alicyclobacillus sp. SO9]|uniref:type II secretion system F family protein n=1 Tax=Alicyclobacillus sp. SO9 TaxID=2665646 RepID=UPI0018E71595|nr:type II secretion system F family protein [Alicyclobacillus sp. SO9]QQE79557.1 type II secretion system F family protein [Alicyclobacillus sp. SO9]
MTFLGIVLITFLLGMTLWVRSRHRLHQQSMMLPGYRRTFRQKQSLTVKWGRGVRNWLKHLGGTSWMLTGLGTVLGAALGYMGFQSFTVGALVGLCTPLFVTLWLKKYLEKEYLQQVKDTLRFLESSFSSGGQMEDALPEMLNRSQGRMRREVEVAVALQRNGTPMRDILIHWNEMTLEPHLAFALRSIADVLKDAGDLVTVVSESITEMQRDEQFREALQVVTRNSWVNLSLVLSFPVISFLLFHHVVLTELQEMPWLTAVLGAGVLGFGSIFTWFIYVSRV